MTKKIILTAAFFLMTAVILGALGAHKLKELSKAGLMDPERVTSFMTGVTYQFYHGFALLIVALLMEVFKRPGLKWAAFMFIIGIFFFSGSIYLLSTRELSGMEAGFLGPLTPVGGLFFVAGWIITFIQFLKKQA